MQLFVRVLDGATRVVVASPSDTVGALKSQVKGNVGSQLSLLSGTRMEDQRTLQSYGINSETTLQLLGRLRGGKPVKVTILTEHLPCGKEVTIDLSEKSPKMEIKRKLFAVTGVPVEYQRVILSGINQLAMGDKRTNVRFGSCGTASGISMAVKNAGLEKKR